MCISKTINKILKHIYLIFEKLKLNYVVQNFLEYLNSGVKPKENITVSLVNGLWETSSLLIIL